MVRYPGSHKYVTMIHGQIMVRSWSDHGQVMVGSWSDHGQIMVKSWSDHGQVRVGFDHGLTMLDHCH